MTNSDEVLVVRDLTVTAMREDRLDDVVKGVSLTVRQGEIFGIVGESGSGKTILTKAATGLLPHTVRISGGTVELLGRDVTHADEAMWASVHADDIGVVFQNAATALNPRMTVFSQVREALPATAGRTRPDDARRVVDLLEAVEIDNPVRRLKQYPHELSGGIAQRVVIAMALARNPRLLLADEATTALDAVVQRQILDLVATLRDQRNLAVILISHDLDVVRDRSDRIAVMQKGSVVEMGPTSKIIAAAEHPYTRELLASSQSVLLARLQDRQHSHAGTDRSAAPIVELQGVTKTFLRESRRVLRTRYAGVRPGPAVDDLTIDVRPGEIVGIVGASGSGKTTAARMLVDLVRPDAGEVRFDGRDVRTFGRRDRLAWHRDVQYVFQDNYGALNPRYTVAESILEPLTVTGGTPQDSGWTSLDEVLTSVGLNADFADRRPRQLSGGERQRAGIARALITRPRLIVADEPVSALDVTVQKKILDLIVDLNRSHGTAFLVISHDLGVISYLASRVLVMNHGSVVDEGTTTDVLGAPQHPYTRRLVEAVTHEEPVLLPVGAAGTHADNKESVA